MKFLLLITIIYSLLQLHTASGASGFYKPPNRCLYGDKILSDDERVQVPNKCERVVCGPDGHVELQNCGTVDPPVGYKRGELLSPQAYYPWCCRRNFVRIDPLY